MLSHIAVPLHSPPLAVPPPPLPVQEDKNSHDRYLDHPRWKFQHHTDWVTQVKFVEDMNCVMACSLDKTISITDAGGVGGRGDGGGPGGCRGAGLTLRV